jgi:antitoxin CptB
MNDARLRWQCRRGMRELDILLTGYLDNDYPQAIEAQKEAFRELLSLPDPDLIAYLLGGETPTDSELAGIVRRIRHRPRS